MTIEQFEVELDRLVGKMKEKAKLIESYGAHPGDIAYVAESIAKLADFLAHDGMQ